MHDRAHQRFVVAFRHHADDRLGARFAHQDLSRAIEARLARLDAFGHARIAERSTVPEAHILQYLRQRLEDVRRLAGRLALFRQHRQHLQRRNDAIARRGEIVEDDVAGLFAADIEATLFIISMT